MEKEAPNPTYLLVNFGGPRDLDEIYPFLTTLLCDRDVVYTKFPHFIHRYLFTKIAYRRSIAIRKEYELIGGKSPIYFDTENIAKMSGANVLTFHRYLPATHKESLKRIEEVKDKTIYVFPLFPQFSYATTGSVARFFSKHLTSSSIQKLRWIKSYADHPLFIQAIHKKITNFLIEQQLMLEETVLFFSAHGIPQSFVDRNDPYQNECEKTFQTIIKTFPKALGKLAYQSRFGKELWIKPYTNESCEDVLSWNANRKNIVFFPLSFTTDHIETLSEIEHQYLPLIRKKNLNAFRCPALNLEPYWMDGIKLLFSECSLFTKQTSELYRR